MTQSPVPLTYGTTPRRRRGWWWLGVALILAGIVVVGLRQGWGEAAKRVWDNYEASAPFRRMMSHTFPKGMVVWDPNARPPISVPPPIDRSATGVRVSLSGMTPLFIHGRTTRSGVRRLVIIDLVQPGWSHGMHLSTLLFTPGTLTTLPRHHGPDTGLDLPASAAPLRFYAGQVDPNDGSHFTIEFDTPAGRETIDAWLQDTIEPAWDPVKVEMRIRPRK